MVDLWNSNSASIDLLRGIIDVPPRYCVRTKVRLQQAWAGGAVDISAGGVPNRK